MTKRLEVKTESWGIETPSYRDIVETFGEIIVETEWGSYQGDSIYLIRADDKYGVLTFGWGSCSGCDALEACDSQSDVDSLRDDLERGIRWFDTLAEVTGYVEGESLKDSYLDAEMITSFVKSATTITITEGDRHKAVGK